jgi:16S rRNA (uracil1498-N3)-methyltransferase
VIDGERAHHLRHVLRVRAGQLFELSDSSRVYLARVTAATSAAVTFAIEQELPAPALLPEVVLLAAVFKFDRFEWMLEKATELGVARVTPVITARTDTGLAQGAQKRVERWRRIVEEAAQQSRRLAPPLVADPQSLGEAIASAPAGPRWILDETITGPTGASAPATVLLSGPEGGFTDAEREVALRAGFQSVSLGPLILRAETAPLAALAILTWWHSTIKNAPP